MTERQYGPLLLPAESISLTVALAQVLRGEEPTPNVATVCVLALARLDGRHDWSRDVEIPELVDPPGAHHAEPFRQGYEPDVRFGWHCLTCNREEYVPTLKEAEDGATAHIEESLRAASADKP